MSAYTALIRELSAHDPRHVEAWMRLGHPTLDHLDRVAFAREVRIADACIVMNGKGESEALAVSFGL